MCVLFYLKKEALGGFPFFLLTCSMSSYSFISYLNNFPNLLGFEKLATHMRNGIGCERNHKTNTLPTGIGCENNKTSDRCIVVKATKTYARNPSVS